MVEEKPCPILSSYLAAELDGFARVTRELRCDVDHERDKRRRLEDSVRQLEFDHENLGQTMLSHCWRMNGEFIL